MHGADIAPISRKDKSASGLAQCSDDVEVDILVKGKAAAKKLGEDDSSDSDSTTSLGVAGYADDGDVPVDEDDLDRNNISVRVWSQCDLNSIKLIHTQTVNDRALKHSSILSTHMLHITFNLL